MRCCWRSCCWYWNRNTYIWTTLVATLAVETTSSNTIFTIKTTICTSSCRSTPGTRPSSRIGGRKSPSGWTTWCTYRWSGLTMTNFFKCVTISIFNTAKLRLTVTSAIMLVAAIWLKIINPRVETVLVSDP